VYVFEGRWIRKDIPADCSTAPGSGEDVTLTSSLTVTIL